jgi:biopolymer transport protein ExbB
MILLAGLLTAAVFLVSDGFAQTTAPANGATETAKPKPAGLMTLILSHPDPVFFTIAGLSVWGLALIIQGFIKTRQNVFMPETSTNTIRDLITQRRYQELIDFTETDPSFVSKVLNPALKRAPSWLSMKETLETAVGEETAEQFRRIEYLNIIGNLGPLLGLLGTVLGMIEAFQAVATTGGQADVAALSGGISTALCHTFLGLFLAVPCLAAFGFYRTLVDRLTIRGSLAAEELLLMMKPPEAKPIPAPPARPGNLPTPAPAATMRRSMGTPETA